MFRPRIIPVLLLHNSYLVKSRRFKNYRYIGDPINAVRIFNELDADELVFLDIDATRSRRSINFDLIKKIGEEANMPFSVGGGVQTLSDIRALIAAGAEKAIIGAQAVAQPRFVKEAADEFGSSTLTVCMDVKRTLMGKERVYSRNGTKSSGYDPVVFAQLMAEQGAGEIIVQSIEQDGVMNGYHLPLIKKVAEKVPIPVVALGGAGSLAHLTDAITQSYASAVACGSLFVYYGANKGVLINYPEKGEVNFGNE